MQSSLFFVGAALATTITAARIPPVTVQKITTTSLSTVTTAVPLTVQADITATGATELIPGVLTMTFQNIPAYVYIETATLTTKLANVTGVLRSTITISSSTPTSASVNSTTTIATTKPTTTKTSSSITSSSSISTSSIPSTTTTPSTTPPSSNTTSSQKCDYTSSWSVSNDAYTLQTYTNTASITDCASLCSSTPSCKSFSQQHLSTNYWCKLYSVTVTALAAAGEISSSTSDQAAIFNDASCLAPLPSGTTCGLASDAYKAVGGSHAIGYSEPIGVDSGACYNLCQQTAGCLSYYNVGYSNDDDGNPTVGCYLFNAPVSSVFKSGGTKGKIASDAACVPFINY